MVTSIAASSVIVRIWPVGRGSSPPASRHLHLYQAPIAPIPDTVAAAARPAAGSRQTRQPVRPAADVSVAQVEAVVTGGEPLLAPEAGPQTIAAVDPPAVPAGVDLPLEPAVVHTAVDAPLETPDAETASAEGPAPAVALSRSIADVPAAAVTRAVTVAGRGIMTGLKATSAILRAPF
jgi:hypothetical protein